VLRYLLSAALATSLLAIVACAPRPYVVQRQLTGTCDGVCDYYLACKRSGDVQTRQACVKECSFIFSDDESLMAFESLECADAVAYVEGPSGRAPGSSVGQVHKPTGSAAASRSTSPVDHTP
jgi:hypothetical protein